MSNTTKLYQLETGEFVFELSNGVQYTMAAAGAVFVSNMSTTGLTEVPFDITVSAAIDNAIQKCGSVVIDMDELKLIEAFIQEKVEDFD